MPPPFGPGCALLEGLLDLLDLEELEDVALLDVRVALEDDAAFVALGDLGDVVLEAAQGAEPAGPDDGAVADEADLGRRSCRRARP